MIPHLGFAGKAGSGKDTCARVAREIAKQEYGALWGDYAFAWPLKAHVYARNSFPLEDVLYHKPEPVRKALIHGGNRDGRHRFGDGYWVRQAEVILEFLKEGFPFVSGLTMSDIRYPNERDYCRLGGRNPDKVLDSIYGEIAAQLRYEEQHDNLLEEDIDALVALDTQFFLRAGERWMEEVSRSPGLVLWVQSDRPTLEGDIAQDESETQFDEYDLDNEFDGIVVNNTSTSLAELREQIQPYVAKLIEEHNIDANG